MNDLVAFWQLFLYQPLVNALVYFYNTIAQQNLGWAVVALTLALRIFLLPLSIMAERNAMAYEEMEEKIIEAQKRHRADPVYLKEYVRHLARKYKIRPWAKTTALASQLLVLVLLYQVFITGIQGTQLARILYPGIDYPGKLNTVFFSVPYGPTAAQTLVFDVGHQSIIWPAIVAAVLIIEILIRRQGKKGKMTGREKTFLIVFPLLSFLFLWWLPMVKSLFILTSLLFSYLLTLIRVTFFKKKKAGAAHH